MAIFEKEKKELEQRVSELEKEKAEAEQKATNATTQHNNLKVGLRQIFIKTKRTTD
jgi:hypothetical protein